MKESLFVLGALFFLIAIAMIIGFEIAPKRYLKTEVNNDEHKLMIKDSNVPIKIDTIEYNGQQYVVFHGGVYFSVCPKKEQ